MTSARAILIVSSVVLGHARAAIAEEASGKAWVPSASFALGAFDERLRVRIDGTDYDSYRGQLRTIFALGVGHPVARFDDARFSLDGHSSIGAGLTFETGHWHFPLREDATLAYAANRWLTLRAGLGAGVTIDATAGSRSFAELALPISVTFFRRLEIVYRPMVSVPLGRETSPVLGGDRELSTRLAVLPFEIAARVRVDALGW